MEYGITSLKNKYSGPVTLVGNGPSLDFDNIDSPSIAMNSITLAFPNTDWRPDFYVCISRELINNETMMGRVIDALELGIPCFLNVNYNPRLRDWPNAHYISLATSRHAPLQGDWLQNGVWFLSYATTMTVTAGIAQYLGFGAIEFIGIDGYVTCPKDNDLNHFDESYNEDILPDDKDTEDTVQVNLINVRQARAMEFVYHNLIEGGVSVQRAKGKNGL
jgi:hypothetical protein